MNQNIKIDPYGFREYDARWLYEKDISKEGSHESWQRSRNSNKKTYSKRESKSNRWTRL
jgi:phosphomannomutase/phosphoglucomutase